MTGGGSEVGRGPVAGVAMILRYNWPLYVAGLATAATGAAVAASTTPPRSVRFAGGAAAAGAGWLAIASLAASWWVYDRSELYRWTWLTSAVPGKPDDVLVVHAGLDEASQPVGRLWPDATVTSVDVHGGTGPTTSSLRRARATATSADGDELPTSGSFDVAVAFLAAHEIRTHHGRVELLEDLRRSLRPGGRLVLVEHVRDLVNALAYGPAINHFYPVEEWHRVLNAADLDIVGEGRITPFVVVLTARKTT